MNVIKQTFAATTQLAKHMAATGTHKTHFKARFPQLNRRCLHETYTTDTLFATEKALQGETCCQIFVGTTLQFTYVYGMKSESKGATKLKQFVKEVGTPFAITSDNAKIQIGTAFYDICSMYNIGQ